MEATGLLRSVEYNSRCQHPLTYRVHQCLCTWWIPYQPMGKQIRGTRFITFKVPLKEALCNQLEETLRFTPQMLLDKCPDMKMIVDLTNTTRFYDRREFSENGVEYIKIQTPGHVIPASSYIQQFFSCVDAFLSSTAEEPESLIGVHCTHGLNRTAYFVCCYMIHRLGIEPQDAVDAFEEARGHKVERMYYVKDLLKRGMGAPAPPGYTTARDAYARHGVRDLPYSRPPPPNHRSRPPGSSRYPQTQFQEGDNPSGRDSRQPPLIQENWRQRDPCPTSQEPPRGWNRSYGGDSVFGATFRNDQQRGPDGSHQRQQSSDHRSEQHPYTERQQGPTGPMSHGQGPSGSVYPGQQAAPSTYAEHRRLRELERSRFNWRADPGTTDKTYSSSGSNFTANVSSNRMKKSRWGSEEGAV